MQPRLAATPHHSADNVSSKVHSVGTLAPEVRGQNGSPANTEASIQNGESDLSALSTAFVHDWLPVFAGAERVLEQMLSVFPQSDLFTLIEDLPDEQRAFLEEHTVHTSFIQRMPFGRSRYRYYLPLAPLAIEQFDLSAYDLVVSSNYAVAKGVLTTADQLHVSYTHSPIRYAWDLYFQYMRDEKVQSRPKSWVARLVLHYMRFYDVLAARRVDAFIANSEHVSRRIWKTYRRPAEVVYPPVDTAAFSLYEHKEDFYLTLSRLVPYKRIDLIVEAFSDMPGKELVVIGEGPELEKLRRKAGPNVSLLGYQPFDAVLYYMQRARAFVFAAEEDFGIVPVEAQSCGTPVIAYARGGALETVVPNKTGLLFKEQSTACLQQAIRTFEREAHLAEPGAIRDHAQKFSTSRFRKNFKKVIERYRDDFNRHGPAMSASEISSSRRSHNGAG